jgi:hypothetical protein
MQLTNILCCRVRGRDHDYQPCLMYPVLRAGLVLCPAMYATSVLYEGRMTPDPPGLIPMAVRAARPGCSARLPACWQSHRLVADLQQRVRRPIACVGGSAKQRTSHKPQRLINQTAG